MERLGQTPGGGAAGAPKGAEAPQDVQGTRQYGMLGSDRELFAQVWSRVSPGETGPVEAVPPAEVVPPAEEPLPVPLGSCTGGGPTPAEEVSPPEEEAPPGEALSCFGADPSALRQLRGLTARCLGDAGTYRDLARRSRRGQRELGEMFRRKVRQAKRLSAAYFLMTGVRYWPGEERPVSPPEPFFPALRQRFLAEQRLARELEALGRKTGDGCLRELYLSLWEETGELVHMIRVLVERES